VSAGSYALTEQTQAGYAPSTWSCSGGSQTGANIALALGGSATCTISNDDIAPTLTLVKVVTNDNGGTKTLSDFPLTASGPVTISGVSGTTSVTSRPVNAGSYALTEQTQTGYTASTWSCSGGSQTGANIALPLGGSATCTISNNDNPSFIIIDKISQGGVGTFTFATTGFSMPNSNTLTTVTSGVAVSTGQISVNAGAALSVGEPSPPAGFQLMASSCVVNQGAATIVPTTVGGVNVSEAVTITQPGSIVECTFDNAVVSGVTRTQGFWATHTALSNLIWDTLVPTVDKQLCTATILTNADPSTELSAPGTNQLMGGFWSNIAKTSTKTSRTDLDQARMQALQQYLAAAINVAQFHSNTEAFLAAARTIYCGTDVSAIQGLIGTLGTYNSSGDAGAFDPGVSATAQESKKEANIPFWDVTIH
jgi:prealbumin domain-containing protein